MIMGRLVSKIREIDYPRFSNILQFETVYCFAVIMLFEAYRIIIITIAKGKARG